MDAQLQKLIEKIKEDGVQSAREEGDKIVSQAKDQAEKILSEAKNEAQKKIKKAEEEARLAETRGREALKQAGRDLLLSLKEEVLSFFDAYLKEASADALKKKDVVQKGLESILSQWKTGSEGDMSVLLPEGQFKDMEAHLKGVLADQIKKGLTLKPTDNLDAGFRITEKDGSAYYDFSAETMAEALSDYMNPQLAGILKESAKES